MPHPYPKPILPTWPMVPLVKPNPAFPAPYDSAPDADARVSLWTWREFLAESDQFCKQQGESSHAARSTRWFVQNVADNAIGAGANPADMVWAVQSTAEDFGPLDQQQVASLADSCTRARMYGCGSTNFLPSCYHDNGTKVPDIISGGSFSSDNFDAEGNVVWQGVNAGDTLAIFRNGLTNYLKAGGLTN